MWPYIYLVFLFSHLFLYFSPCFLLSERRKLKILFGKVPFPHHLRSSYCFLRCFFIPSFENAFYLITLSAFLLALANYSFLSTKTASARIRFSSHVHKLCVSSIYCSKLPFKHKSVFLHMFSNFVFHLFTVRSCLLITYWVFLLAQHFVSAFNVVCQGVSSPRFMS